MPTKELFLELKTYTNSDKSHTMWIINTKEFENIEDAIVRYYQLRGYNAWRNERALITNLFSVFKQLMPGYDYGLDFTLKDKTREGEEKTNISKTELLNKEVTSRTLEAYLQKKFEFENLIDILKNSSDLIELYKELRKKRDEAYFEYIQILKDNDLPVSPYGRDPSDDDYWELLTINAIENIPKDKLIQMIEWAFQKLDERSYGWPDLLITKNGEYRFIEIKSPTDALHLTQYQWFKWALDNEINCELCNISTNIA